MGSLGGKSGNLSWAYERISVNLLALASDTLVSGAGPILEQDYRMSKAEGVAMVDNLTNDQGPLMIGIYDGSYTDAEVVECLVARPAQDDDLPSIEHSMRRGVFPLTWIEGSDNHKFRLFSTKINYRFKHDPEQIDAGWRLFCFNADTAALTTGGIFRVHMKHWGVWI